MELVELFTIAAISCEIAEGDRLFSHHLTGEHVIRAEMPLQEREDYFD